MVAKDAQAEEIGLANDVLTGSWTATVNARAARPAGRWVARQVALHVQQSAVEQMGGQPSQARFGFINTRGFEARAVCQELGLKAGPGGYQMS